MIVFVDSDSKIRAVGKTNDASLTPLYISDEDNPFKGWSKAKICCYKVTVSDGHVTMMTPYVDSRMLDQIDLMGHAIEDQAPFEDNATASYGDEDVYFTGVPNGVVSVDIEPLNGDVPVFHVSRNEDIVRVFFDEPLSYAADIRLIVN
jgi:hypothetical protein